MVLYWRKVRGMKWFFGLVLVIATITGGLYAVGRFLLPNTLSVTRSATIERPRAAVFAMSNDLKIVKEWSPYYALDPDAEYVFSGDESGAGQTMRWVSDVRQVGNGRMSIVRSEPYEEIETILDLGDRAMLNTLMHLTPAATGTNVAWSVSAECAAGAINVPCRYMNLIMRGMVRRDLDAGLGRLKTLSEQLPNVDFADLNPEFITLEPQSYVYSPVTTSNQNQLQVDTALNAGVSQVDTFMTQNALVRSGPQVRVTTQWDQSQNQMSFRVGYPFSGPTPLTVVGVQIGETPSGRALRVVHNGPRAQMRTTYAKIYAFLQAHRIDVREDGLPWEVVIAEGDEANPQATQIEIYVPLE
jgi:effector-binding domain-containing protein